jgi:F-type H+-transporting ATPase subunit delta
LCACESLRKLPQTARPEDFDRVTSKAAAHRYSRALFDMALKERQNLDEIEAQLAEFVDLLRHYPALEKVLLNPAVPVPRKRAAVAELTTKLNVNAMLAKLLALLADRDRLVVLPDLLSSYQERLRNHRGVIRADVTTAAPLSAEQSQQIENRLSQVTGRTVTVSARVDPSIIGGVITRIGGTVYDASVTRQLEKMRSRLVAGV